MTVSITDLTSTKQYADDTKWTEAQADAWRTSSDDHINTKISRNIEQIGKDAWGNDNYTLNDNGDPSLDNTLFDKQFETENYNGGDITIGTSADVGYAAVEAVNAAISITPELPGRYRVDFRFTHRVTSNATSEMTAETSFRLTDGSTASPCISSGGRVPATAAGSGVLIFPVHLSHIFEWDSTSARTITLQKFNRSMTNISANVVNATPTTGEISMTVEKV